MGNPSEAVLNPAIRVERGYIIVTTSNNEYQFMVEPEQLKDIQDVFDSPEIFITREELFVKGFGTDTHTVNGRLMHKCEFHCDTGYVQFHRDAYYYVTTTPNANVYIMCAWFLDAKDFSRFICNHVFHISFQTRDQVFTFMVTSNCKSDVEFLNALKYAFQDHNSDVSSGEKSTGFTRVIKDLLKGK